MKTIQRYFVIIILIIAITLLVTFYIIPIFQKKSIISVIQNSLVKPIYPTLQNNESTEITPIPENTEVIEIPTLVPTIIPTVTPTPTLVATKYIDSDTAPWGVAQQISEHTWTIKVANDLVMANPTEILDALNNYRVAHGSQRLTMDSKLSEYAQSRANYFYQQEKLDSHQGFNNFLTNENGFDKLGFSWLGENASYGYRLNGVHLIEWIYASDQDHDQNQLNNNWNYIGIGVKDTATCLIFGTGKR